MKWKSSMRRHEVWGEVLLFVGATCIGLGLYFALLGAVGNSLVFQGSYFLKGKDFLLFPGFFGLGALLWKLGSIELKETLPGKVRRDNMEKETKLFGMKEFIGGLCAGILVGFVLAIFFF